MNSIEANDIAWSSVLSGDADRVTRSGVAEVR